MKIEFANGVLKPCNSPVEQKLFAKESEYAWIFIVTIIDNMNSSDVDELFTLENISHMKLIDDNGNLKSEFVGYDTITSLSIRHSENTLVELQMRKFIK